jgi:hypothetical protein
VNGRAIAEKEKFAQQTALESKFPKSIKARR